MKRISIYQFIRTSEPKRFFEYVDKTNKLNSVAVLDLEDAALIPFNAKKSNHLKSVIRKEITSLISCSEFSNRYKLGIRLNSFSDSNFSKDLQFAKKLNKNIDWNCIFLPKIQDKNQLIMCLTMLKENDISFKDAIPIIECAEGVKNLKDILYAKSDLNFNKIAFGHCDYNLNCNNFPFYHHNSKKYLSIIKPIIKLVEENNFEYINSPFLELNNYNGFINNLKNLNSNCKRNYGQVTLTLDQTLLCNKFYSNKSINSFEDFQSITTDFNKKKIIAKNLFSEYTNNRIPGRGFALTKLERKLISPQEFISALRYLNKI